MIQFFESGQIFFNKFFVSPDNVVQSSTHSSSAPKRYSVNAATEILSLQTPFVSPVF